MQLNSRSSMLNTQPNVSTCIGHWGSEKNMSVDIKEPGLKIKQN
jgi:hypothetical protein